MTAPRKKHCPLCWRMVGRAGGAGDVIEGHWDTIGVPCLMSGEPYRTTLSRKPIQKDDDATWELRLVPRSVTTASTPVGTRSSSRGRSCSTAARVNAGCAPDAASYASARPGSIAS